MDIPVFQRSCTNNMTHNSDGNMMDTPVFQIHPYFTHVESHASGVSLLESGK